MSGIQPKAVYLSTETETNTMGIFCSPAFLQPRDVISLADKFFLH